jgi:hypothetical protein
MGGMTKRAKQAFAKKEVAGKFVKENRRCQLVELIGFFELLELIK